MNAFLEASGASLSGFRNPDIFRRCFSLMDLTTLRSQDTADSVRELVSKVNAIPELYPAYPLPASVCVFPNFGRTVRESLSSSAVRVTCVSGCFPSSQSFPEVKARECELAVENGADEIDIVLALNSFLAGDRDSASAEISLMRTAVDAAGEKAGRKIVLKVILETGLLSTPETIAAASFLAMEAGADFIKTSTGKVEVNATTEAAYVMCRCIAMFYAKTGRKVGFKAAGGISSAEDALKYYAIVSGLLGEGWLDCGFFRLGVSRLGNSLMSAAEGREIRYF